MTGMLARISVHKVETPTVIDGLIITAFHMFMSSFGQLLYAQSVYRVSQRTVCVVYCRANVVCVLIAGADERHVAGVVGIVGVVNVYAKLFEQRFARSAPVVSSADADDDDVDDDDADGRLSQCHV